MVFKLTSIGCVAALWVATCIPAFAAGQAAPTPSKTEYKFEFGTAAPDAGFTAVHSSEEYTAAKGYGFEPGARTKDLEHSLTGTGVFYFSAAVPEGNYRVTMTLGDPTAESMTTVKAELRRLMLERVHTDPGQFVTRTFNVNIRQPQIAGGGEVRRKAPRETTSEAWAWDDKMTLEFADTHPAVSKIEISKVDNLPTLFVIGDSTSTDQSGEPFNSWGQTITRFFGTDIVVANHGESGETSNSFIGERRWAKVLSVIKPGDFVIMQFAHNDEKDKGPDAGAYKNYKTALSRFVKETREHGATPILVTPMNRKTFRGNEVTNSHGDYPDAIRQVATEQKADLVDLTKMSKTLYEAIGPEKAGILFANAREATHNSDYGSYELSKCIIQSIKDQNLSLAKFILPDLAPFDPAHPDSFDEFKIPADTRGRAAATPLGS